MPVVASNSFSRAGRAWTAGCSRWATFLPGCPAGRSSRPSSWPSTPWPYLVARPMKVGLRGLALKGVGRAEIFARQPPGIGATSLTTSARKNPRHGRNGVSCGRSHDPGHCTANDTLVSTRSRSRGRPKMGGGRSMVEEGSAQGLPVPPVSNPCRVGVEGPAGSYGLLGTNGCAKDHAPRI